MFISEHLQWLLATLPVLEINYGKCRLVLRWINILQPLARDRSANQIHHPLTRQVMASKNYPWLSSLPPSILTMVSNHTYLCCSWQSLSNLTTWVLIVQGKISKNSCCKQVAGCKSFGLHPKGCLDKLPKFVMRHCSPVMLQSVDTFQTAENGG